MTSETFLITGAFGCIGAWAARQLVREGANVVSYDLGERPHRMQLIMSPAELAEIRFVRGDVTDLDGVNAAIGEHGVTRILHLAALVHPFVLADPVLGARVNVVGHAVLFEAARKHANQVNGVVYASSVAAYGPAAMYPPGRLAPDAPLAPASLYGVTKVANEEWARVCWQDWQVRSVGLRPFFVYGPGRDQGISATPTKAMVAAVAGRPYHIGFGGTAMYQHAQDAAAAFIQASRAMPDGAPVCNLGGEVAHMDEIVAAIVENASNAAGLITHEPNPLFFPDALDSSSLDATIGATHWRTISQGIR
ncbi:MAG: NAD-dependent epimerase/dehydratase family protein, partial [Thermomicrobiales bacterium]